MLRIRMLSGEEVNMPVGEVSCVREAKRRLHQLHGVPPRFRQRLILHGTNLDDAYELDSPLELDLILQPFSDTSETQVKELVAAARDGLVEKVETMLRLPQDPNLAGEHEPVPILQASQQGHIDVVRLLMEAGAEKEVTDCEGYTALHLAVVGGYIEVVRLLVEAGADKDVADNIGYTALMFAALRGHIEVVLLLVEAGADKDLIGINGHTALMHAAAKGHVEVVRLLVEAGADMDVVDNYDYTALMFAALRGHIEVVRLLAEAGADKDLIGNNGHTALMHAAANGHVEVVRLLEAGADKDASPSKRRRLS